MAFVDAVVAQLTGPAGALRGADAEERARLTETVRALLRGAGGNEHEALAELLRADHALAASFFQNLDLLHRHDHPRADAVARLVMRAIEGWYPEHGASG